MQVTKKRVVLFGAGASNLIAAYFLADYFNIIIFEKEKSIGRKFLIAGKGGLNLTNNLPINKFLKNYTPKYFLDDAVKSFNANALRQWLLNLNIPTFIGSSGKIFPKKEINPALVLNTIKKNLLKMNVKIITKCEFLKFTDNHKPIINCKGKKIISEADYFIFGLGGASWPQTGSNGAWKVAFEKIGIKTANFQASNCGININWSSHIKKYHVGKPLKNIKISFGRKNFLGEAVITNYGLEGGLIYKLIPYIRKSFDKNKKTVIKLDFKPYNEKFQLIKKISPLKYTSKDYMKILNINKLHLSLIKEYSTKEEYLDKKTFIEKLKGLLLKVESLRPLEEAISTIGGIETTELNPDFSLKKNPAIFTIGEMVNWDAPTGGFLLQACFSMGFYAAQSIIKQNIIR